jgi:hypothetical protein
MFKGQIQTNNNRFKTKVSALSAAKTPHASIQLGMDELSHNQIFNMIHKVINDYKHLMLDKPYFVTVAVTSNPNGEKKETTFEVLFDQLGEAHITGWNEHVQFYPIDAAFFESFLYEQTVLGKVGLLKEKIDLALKQQDKENFNTYASEINKLQTYLGN